MLHFFFLEGVANGNDYALIIHETIKRKPDSERSESNMTTNYELKLNKLFWNERKHNP